MEIGRLTRLGLGAGGVEGSHLAAPVVEVAELAVDGGEADVGDLVELFELGEDRLADGSAWYLASAGVEQFDLDLADLAPEPPAPAGIEPRPGDAPTAAELNDRAYGYGPDGFRAGLGGETVIRWHAAYDGKEAIGCVGTIEVGDDCCVTGVATPPEHRGRGVASWLLWRALDEAREGGLRSASLQASRAGAPLYERLGFADLGFVEMWELRR